MEGRRRDPRLVVPGDAHQIYATPGKETLSNGIESKNIPERLKALESHIVSKEIWIHAK